MRAALTLCALALSTCSACAHTQDPSAGVAWKLLTGACRVVAAIDAATPSAAVKP